MRRRFATASAAIAIWFGLAQPVDAQAVNCLTPGEFRDNIGELMRNLAGRGLLK